MFTEFDDRYWSWWETTHLAQTLFSSHHPFGHDEISPNHIEAPENTHLAGGIV